VIDHKLRFVHLSDIHFSHRAVDFGFDPDRALRAEVVADVAKMREKTGKITGVLVSGDIAYAGKKSEYDNAAGWLDEVAGAAGCDRTAVWLCPGNHDVDQAVIKENPLIQDGHDKVRSFATFEDMDAELTRKLVQPQACALLYAPLREYNEFAARYESEFYADNDHFAWENDFMLNDGSTLRLRGLNTALLSGLSDCERSLFLGRRAWTLPRRSAVEYMTMAHHPPSWLADGKEAEKTFDAYARIQLFGHEHDQRIVPGRDWIKLFAGSTNPHRMEPSWKPGYNIVEIHVETSADRHLIVDVHAREWQVNPPFFRALEDVGGKPVYSVKLLLAPLPVDFVAVTVTEDDLFTEECEPSVSSDEPKMSAPDDKALDFRSIVYDFFRLTLSKKNEIVGHLRLSDDTDSQLSDVERFKRALLRAKDLGQLGEVQTLIAKLEKMP
jgi:GTPase-associated adaptor domain/Calcineurin-like phosphoesterase